MDACTGQLETSNTEQVRKLRRILEERFLQIVTPDQARAIVANGRNAVGF